MLNGYNLKFSRIFKALFFITIFPILFGTFTHYSPLY